MSDWKVLIKDGKFCWWSGSIYDEEKDNFEWVDTMTYEGYERGCSSCVLLFHSKKYNCTMHMFMTDFNDVAFNMIHGQLIGTFTFCKRGQNYGVKAVL